MASSPITLFLFTFIFFTHNLCVCLSPKHHSLVSWKSSNVILQSTRHASPTRHPLHGAYLLYEPDQRRCVVKPFHVRAPVSTCSIDEIRISSIEVRWGRRAGLCSNHLVEPRPGSRSEAVASTPAHRARASTCINSVSLAVGVRALTLVGSRFFSCQPGSNLAK